jgi:KDO2-lipid IV(A) lauroyltransferase
LSCALQRRTRRHLYRNLEAAFGDTMSVRALRRLRLRIYANFAVFVADFLKFPKITRANLAEWLTESSFGRLAALGELARRGPVIFLTAHFGNWELGAAATALMGHPITVLADVHPSPQVTAFFNGRREAKGCTVFPVTAFHRCFSALKAGSIVAIVGDRPVTGQGIHARFMGRTALMPDGHAVLARRLGATIVPCFLLMTDGGRYDLIVDDPIVPRVTADEEADIRDCVDRCLGVVERHVRAHPDQWYVFRPMWHERSGAGEDRLAARSRRRAGQRASP